jgi:8-oxo-dGTP diphosphatase
MRRIIKKLVEEITPFDKTEHAHITDTIKWIDSGAPLFRIKKPDVPNKHLVSYFELFDKHNKKFLLTDHKKSGLWLPPGGHVDYNAHPTDTVKRECLEELNLEAKFLDSNPILITSTVTVGKTAGHTDVSFWYVLYGNSNQKIEFDKSEFYDIRWFTEENMPFENTDPNMQRFIRKFLLK